MSIRKYFFSESADENIAGSERGWVLYSDYEQLERTAKMLAEALDRTRRWTEAALQCRTWHWDGDQREACEFEVKEANAALAAARKDGLL